MRRAGPGARIRYGIALVIVVAVAIVAVALVRSPTRTCKGVGIGRVLGEQGALQIDTFPTAAAAVDDYVHGSPLSFTGEPVPTDGWHEDGRVWVRDLPDGRRYEVTVRQQVDDRWLVSGSWSIC